MRTLHIKWMSFISHIYCYRKKEGNTRRAVSYARNIFSITDTHFIRYIRIQRCLYLRYIQHVYPSNKSCLFPINIKFTTQRSRLCCSNSCNTPFDNTNRRRSFADTSRSYSNTVVAYNKYFEEIEPFILHPDPLTQLYSPDISSYYLDSEPSIGTQQITGVGDWDETSTQNPVDVQLTNQLYNDVRRLLYTLTVNNIHDAIKPEHWVQAEQYIHGLSNTPTIESVNLSLKLIDALMNIIQNNKNFIFSSNQGHTSSQGMVETIDEFDSNLAHFLTLWDMWHGILSNWHIVSKEYLRNTTPNILSSEKVPSPMELLPQLERWNDILKNISLGSTYPNSTIEVESHFCINSVTLSILINVVSIQGKLLFSHPNTVEAEILPFAEFAEKLFLRMISESTKASSKNNFLPSVSNLNMVLTLWARSGGVDQAWRLLQHMTSSGAVEPDVRSFNSVIQSYAVKGDGASAERVLYKLLRRHQTQQEEYNLNLQDKSPLDSLNVIYPTIISWNTVLAAWVKSPDKLEAAKRVEHLLRTMVDYANGGRISDNPDQRIKVDILQVNQNPESNSWRHTMKPDLVTFNTALAAWARIGETDTCSLLLREMRELYKSGQLADPPDHYSYTTVMNAFAKALQPEKAEELWEGIYQAYQQSGKEELKPTIAMLTTILDAYSRSIADAVTKKGNIESAKEGLIGAERIFDRIRDLYRSGELDTGPDVFSYNVMLKCYLFFGYFRERTGITREVVSKADTLFDEMKKLQSSNHQVAAPNFITYSIIIQSWLNCRDGVSRAIELLDEIWKKRETGDPRMQPTPNCINSIATAFCHANQPRVAQKFLLSICELKRNNHSSIVEPKINTFAAVLAALNRSKDKDAAWLAQSLVDQMEILHTQQVLSQGPDNRIYQTLIGIWGNSDYPYHAKKAYAIFSEMKRRASEGDKSMRPDLKTCHQVLHALSRKLPDPVLAEKVVKTMYDEYKNNLSDVKPDDTTFNYALLAWSRFDNPESVHRVDALFQEMQLLHKAGDITCTVTTFNIVLNSLAKTSKREGAERAEALISQMNEFVKTGQESFRPTPVSYGCLISAWVRVLDIPRAEAVLVHMYREFQNGNVNMKPSTRHFEQVAKGWLWTNDESRKTKSETVLKLMKLVYPATSIDESKKKHEATKA